IAPSPFGDACTWKAWYGDCWDLAKGPENPYLLAGGVHPVTGQCCVRSYENFTIGGEPGNEVCGVVFVDENGNGVRDPGEAGAPGIGVELADGGTVWMTLSNIDGEYCFFEVAPGTYDVRVLLDGTGFVATTATQQTVIVTGCATTSVP